MKTKIEVQFNDVNMQVAEMEKLVKEELKKMKIKMVQVDTLDVYYQPINQTIFYLATMKDETTVDGRITL